LLERAQDNQRCASLLDSPLLNERQELLKDLIHSFFGFPVKKYSLPTPSAAEDYRHGAKRIEQRAEGTPCPVLFASDGLLDPSASGACPEQRRRVSLWCALPEFAQAAQNFNFANTQFTEVAQ
jgi:hypothetical protein